MLVYAIHGLNIRPGVRDIVQTTLDYYRSCITSQYYADMLMKHMLTLQ